MLSLAEIKDAVIELTPQELAELTAFIRAHENPPFDGEIEKDFSPGIRHQALLAQIETAIHAAEEPGLL